MIRIKKAIYLNEEYDVLNPVPGTICITWDPINGFSWVDNTR
jgi:hypothetical protein